MDNPMQNRMACIKCGRIFPREQFRDAHPTCPVCGPAAPLKPWMESPLWTFLLFGAFGLPFVGRMLVGAVSVMGMNASIARYAAFFLLPAFLLLTNVPSYLVGRQSGNNVVKRGGQQGLLMIIGFLVSVGVLVFTNNFESMAGMK
jgi:hypothetical protein